MAPALQAPPLPPALLDGGLIITRSWKMSQTQNSKDPGACSGTCPILPDSPDPCPHIRAVSPDQVLSCLSAPTWVLEKSALLPEGEPRKDPLFFPWVGV